MGSTRASMAYALGRNMSQIPSGKLTYLWKITISNGKIHHNWPFSIAMLNYQSVSIPILEVSPKKRE
jgi:hypothetical protein